MSKFKYDPSQYSDVIPQLVKVTIEDKLGVDECDIVSDAKWLDDLGCDSLDVVELIMEFEKIYRIQIPDEKAEICYTVGDFVKLLRTLTDEV